MPVRELKFTDGGADKATDHETEVAVVEGGSNGVRGDNSCNVGWHDPDGFNGTGGETKDGSNGGGDCSHDVGVPAVVEVDGD